MLYSLHKHIAVAVIDTVVCKIIFLLLSVCTSTTGEADVRSLNIGNVAKCLRFFSTWYLQQGSHCHDNV